MTFELHKQAIADATDNELASWVSIAVAECRRRALMAKAYHPVSTSIVSNLSKNAALKAAGIAHNGSAEVSAEATKTPVLDRLRAHLEVDQCAQLTP